MVPVAWHRPPEGVLKLNIDGSFEQNTTNGGIGGVIRDHFGKWIAGFTCKIKAHNAHHEEILALLHGLNLAKRLNLAHLQVETDSQVLLNNLNNNSRVYSHIYADCRAILQQMGRATMEHISREVNIVADLLAVHGRKTKDPNICIGQLYVFDASPSLISSALERDAMGTTSLRLVPLLYV
ncbi:hypothetical protein MTR67_050883 [Solanum verrucosum]|uniref:RNase H type-1 domain-containing protein n=1 Tax=Solanum verrucosum TaxID=315347 RepID=A0AAF1A1M0_SOLVR|nr:hypothetical protein MTR67_050883 [Solanum verrucosum]